MSNDQANGAQSGQPNQKSTGFDLSGIDLSGILPPGTWEALKPFLSNGLMAGGIYLFLIKPLKDKIEQQNAQLAQMNKKLEDQEEDLEELEEKLEALKRNLNGVNEELDRKAGLFETRRRDSSYTQGSHADRRSGTGTGKNGLTF